MIADFSDDIDTLLVFAGLFSAVLTAFLVVSIVQLQPDNSATSTQLLSLIALQNGAPSHMQPFLNATAESLPTSTTFRAQSSVVTVNTLWFTSLVLALAAALLGILAKQWCREYLRWHNSILPPRENVLLRQIRFEAWQEWRVPGVIALIPAFLEIALILFLAGLLVFISAFSERALTVVVSIAIAGTLFGSAILTLLPAFSRTCSFQSPTGLAAVRIAKPVREAASMAALFTLRLLLRICNFVNLDPEWLDTLWLSYNDRRVQWNKGDHEGWRAHNLSTVRSLSRKASIIPGVERLCVEWMVDLLRPQLAAVDILQTNLLMRALSWVRHGSSNDNLHAAILECLPTIHVSGITYEPAPFRAARIPSRFLSSIRALYPTNVFSVYRMLRSFQEVAQASQRTAVLVSSRVSRYTQSGPFIVAFDSQWLDQHRAARSARHRDPVAVEIGYYLVLSDILLLVDDWISAPFFSREREHLTQQISLLFCMLQLTTQAGFQTIQVAGSRLTWQWAQTLEEVYKKLAPQTEAYRHGLISMCVELCCLLGPVRFVKEEDSQEYRITVKKESLYDLDANPAYKLRTWVVLAVDMYRISNDYRDKDKRHSFVIAVTRVLEIMRRDLGRKVSIGGPNIITPLAELLRCMTQALRWSIIHGIDDGGSLVPLPDGLWVGGILRCYEHARDHPRLEIALTQDEDLRPIFLLVLRLLDTCLGRNLLTGPTIAADFQRLLDLLDHPELPDLPRDLEFDSLKARPRTPPSREAQKVATRLMKLFHYHPENDAPTAETSTHAHVMVEPASDTSTIHTSASQQRNSAPEDQHRAREMLMTNKTTASEFQLAAGYYPLDAWDRVVPVATIHTTTSRDSSDHHALYGNTIHCEDARMKLNGTVANGALDLRLPTSLPRRSSTVRAGGGGEISVSTSSPVPPIGE